MKLEGRRESANVDDRRGMTRGAKIGLGGGAGAIIVTLLALLLGGNPQEALQQAGILGDGRQNEQAEFTPQEQELATFAKQILAGTEDAWTEIFRAEGRTYDPPHMVLYTGSVSTSCGQGSAATGPFYCSADQTVYIDLSFFAQMKQQLGADGDFAYAYVIAHEVGHHVQYLLGTLQRAHEQMARADEAEANQISVRLELQADFYAGVWAYHDNQRYGSLEDGDIEEALNCAQVIGDNYLQEKARGYSVPDSFTHGTSAQRAKWLKLGLSTGNRKLGDTFSPPYARL